MASQHTNQQTTFCEIFTVGPDSSRHVHRRLTGTEAYEHWHVAHYFKEILLYRKVPSLGFDGIPRKDRNLFLYEIFQLFNFELNYLELGPSLFEVIDGIQCVADFMQLPCKTEGVSYYGYEISELFKEAALFLHPKHSITHLENLSALERIDVLYDRAVSSYCFDDVSQLAEIMNRSRICFSNLFLSRTLTFDKVNEVGLAVTYFSLPVLARLLVKPFYFLYGRVDEQSLEAFFINCSKSDLIALLERFRANKWIQRFIATKDFAARQVGEFSILDRNRSAALEAKCFRRDYGSRYKQYLDCL